MHSHKVFIYFLESVLYTSLSLGLLYYLNPSDPLGFHQPFPWIWFIPILFSLQYSYFISISSLLIILGYIFFNYSPITLEDNYFKIYLLSGILLTMVCAHYSNKWRKKNNLLQKELQYTELKFKALENYHSIVSLSHFELEQKYISDTKSLRSVFEELKKIHYSSQNISQTSIKFLQLLNYYCSTIQVSLHDIENNQINSKSNVFLGNIDTIHINDPMIMDALLNKTMTHKAIDKYHSSDESEYMIIKPILDVEETLYGMLVVHEIPFMFFNKNNLILIDILTNYFGILKSSKNNQLSSIIPIGTPLSFEYEVEYLWNNYKKHHIPSAIIATTWQKIALKNNYKEILHQFKRGLDSIFIKETEKYVHVFFLMPFCQDATINGFLKRAHSSLPELLIPGQWTNFQYEHIAITDTNPNTLLNNYMNKHYEH